MSYDALLKSIRDKIKKYNYNSVNFDLALLKEDRFWKILFSRIVFDIRNQGQQKSLLNEGIFRIEKISLDIDNFFAFFEYLKLVDVNKVSFPGSFEKISKDMFFKFGNYKLCFFGNFPGFNIMFNGRDRAKNHCGLEKPIHFVNYYIQNSVMPKSYNEINLSDCEPPHRNVFEAVNHFWGTNWQQYNLSSNNCGIYMPIYDASIAEVNVKKNRFMIRVETDSNRVKTDELSISLIANSNSKKYSEKHKLRDVKNGINVDFNPSYATIYLNRGHQMLDEYHYNPSSNTFVEPTQQSTILEIQKSNFPTELKLHPKIVKVSEKLFHDGYYSQAIFEAVKVLEKEIKTRSGIRDKSGVPLVNHVFNEKRPILKIVEGDDQEHVDEREGFRFLYMGTFQGIKNPKSHSTQHLKDSTKALEYLAFLSLLMKRLDESKKC